MEDGSYLLAGFTTSRDGDIENGHGYDNADCLLAKVTQDGALEWVETFGGAEGDVIYCLEKTSDGGWIACGYTSSTDGEFADIGIHEGLKMGAFEYVQTSDALVIKLDASGETEWIKCVGGKHDDEAAAISETADGGYVLIGETVSGDVKGYHSAKNKYDLFITDIMAAGLSAEGDTQWIKAFGGKERDTASALAVSGGDIYIAGETRSGDGDIKGYHESRSAFDNTIFMPDIWLTVIDADGALKASGCIGGGDSEYSSDILHLDDGGILFVGGTNSGDGDMEGLGHAYPGYSDIYVFRADPGWLPGQQ